MNRRVWTGSLASVIASVGLASGQTAPSTATDGTSTGVVTLRTAGQPDRRLQVLKCERMPDGKILTEVKDLATGQVFTIADTKPFAGIEPTNAKAGALPTMTPATPAGPTTLPGTTIPAAASTVPTARPRNADPLLGGANVPASAAAQTRPVTRYENVPTTTTQTQEYPTLLGKLRSTSTPATTTTTPTTVTPPKQQSALSAALFGTYPTQTQDQPTPLGKTTDTRTTSITTYPNTTTYPTTVTQPIPSSGGLKAALFGSPEQAAVQQSNPTLMGKLFGDKSAPQPAPMMVAQVSAPPISTIGNANIIRPASVASANARMITPITTTAPVPVMESRIVSAMPVAPVMTAPVAATPVQTASYTPVSTDAKDPNFHVVPAAPMTMKQIEDQVKELRMNQRPSKRMEAATALAHGPMANMVEVRQILAEATYRDPVGVVRAHCIELLSKMKYDEYNYKQYLETLVNDEEPAVQKAARLAMK